MMERFQFIFWEALKLLSLAVVALLAVKAIRGFGQARRSRALPLALYAGVIVLAAWGARIIGQDVAAEVYDWAGQRDLDQPGAALLNAERAVDLRPASLAYWQLAASAKFSVRQFASVLRDEPAFRALSRGPLDEDDLMRFAYSRFFTAQYAQVLPLTEEMMRRNPAYPKAYVLEGMALTGLGRYGQAEQRLLQALRILPTQADAVEALAHVYFLMGSMDRAAAVLEATRHYNFPPEERQRFEALRELYEQ